MADKLAYEVRPYVDADEEAVLALLQESLGGGPVGRRTVDFFRWKHQANPFGRSFAFVADADGVLVGFRIFMRWRWRAGATTYEAVRCVDTATHPDHQGQGIFKRLTLGAVDGVRDEIDLIFNTPNSQSRPGYLKMGWTQVGTAPISIRPIRPVAFALGVRGIGGETSTEPVRCGLPTAAEGFPGDGEIAALLERAADGDGRLITDRSPEYLRWRYADAPDLDYRVLSEFRGSALVGLAFGRPRRRGQLAEFTLSEVLVARGDTATARRLLKRVVKESGCDHVATTVGLDPALTRTYRRSGFLAIPGQGMILTTNPLADVVPPPTDLSSWAFALGDLEVF